MGVANPTADPANVVQALVYTLLDVLDATRDLYKTLRNKERRDYEASLRSKGYPDSRRISYIDDDDALAGDESIVIDKAAVTKEFEIGYQDIGAQFAIGDVITQTALQSQIITLQSVLVTTFLYGPTSDDPISHQLSNVLAASRAAGTSSVDILAAQHKRQRALFHPAPRSTHSPVPQSSKPKALPYPVSTEPTSGTSTALVKTHHESSRPRSGTLVRTNPTIADVARRPRPSRTDTASTSFSGMTSYDAQASAPKPLYCLYAMDLQRDPSQALAGSVTSSPEPYCPYCKRILNLSPGKSWEIFKDDDGHERCFRIQNRFVVKCHRDSVDGGYSCILCTRSATIDTVCGDVKALIRHVWMDHGAGEFELEEDILEFGDSPMPERRKRRDSVISSRTDSRRKSDSRRSISLGPSRRNGRRYERDAETTETWSSRPPVGRERG